MLTVHQIEKASARCGREGEDKDFFHDDGEVKKIMQKVVKEESTYPLHHRR